MKIRVKKRKKAAKPELISTPQAKAKIKKFLASRKEKKVEELPPIVTAKCPMCKKKKLLNVLLGPIGCVCWSCGSASDLREQLKKRGWLPPVRFLEAS